jgi:hypothetical protein
MHGSIRVRNLKLDNVIHSTLQAQRRIAVIISEHTELVPHQTVAQKQQINNSSYLGPQLQYLMFFVGISEVPL